VAQPNEIATGTSQAIHQAARPAILHMLDTVQELDERTT
jgi:hypothetical protein